LASMVVLGIWFAAVYTSHHYVLDVLAGIFCAVLGIFIFQSFITKVNPFKRFIEGYVKLIS